MARISTKHQVILPGDEAKGIDRIAVHRAVPDLASALGVFDGLYGLDYLERLRSEERA